MCFTPLTLKRPYKSFTGELTTVVPCGKCHKCLAARRNAWAFRLHHQQQIAESTYFMTLTYADEPLSPNGHGTLCKKHVQDFLKRLRKRNAQKCDWKIKYYCCGEYGSTYLRPHYHLIIFNMHPHFALRSEMVAKDIWTHGQVDIVPANLATITYTVGYIMKGKWTSQPDEQCNVDIETGEVLYDDRVPEYATMSKNLGLNYLTPDLWEWHVDHMVGYCEMPNGTIINMPRYFKDKVFSKEERKELAQEAEMIRQFDWETFANLDYSKIHEQKSAELRNHEKQLILKRLKL